MHLLLHCVCTDHGPTGRRDTGGLLSLSRLLLNCTPIRLWLSDLLASCLLLNVLCKRSLLLLYLLLLLLDIFVDSFQLLSLLQMV